MIDGIAIDELLLISETVIFKFWRFQESLETGKYCANLTSTEGMEVQ